MKDCIVVGSGAAGISAALTLKANRVDFCLLGGKDLSAKIGKAEKISNYPGLADISGEEFAKRLKAQLVQADIPIVEERVVGVYKMSDRYILQTESGKDYESKTVILCVGVENGKTVKGEEEFFGRGVSYCATCDGALYKGKTIAVIATSSRFEKEVGFLSELAKKVYFVPLYRDITFPFDGYGNVERINGVPTELVGAMRVNGIRFGEEEYAIDGAFLLKESTPAKVLCGGLETDGNGVVVDRTGRTNLSGLFAAGDVTGRPYQYAKAVGEGNVCAHGVTAYLRGEK